MVQQQVQLWRQMAVERIDRPYAIVRWAKLVEDRHESPRLFSELAAARGDGSFERAFRKIVRTDVLILSDWGPEGLRHNPLAHPGGDTLVGQTRSDLPPARFQAVVISA